MARGGVVGGRQPDAITGGVYGPGTPSGGTGGGGGGGIDAEHDTEALAALAAHVGSSQNVHGITDTSLLVTQTQLSAAIEAATGALQDQLDDANAALEAAVARIAAIEVGGPYIQGMVSETDPDEDTDRFPDGTPVDFIWIQKKDS